MNKVDLKICKLDERAIIHEYKHEGDMCFDIGIIIDNKNNKPETTIGKESMLHQIDVTEQYFFSNNIDKFSGFTCSIQPHSVVKFHTGLSFEAPIGYGVKIHVRSSTGIKKGLILSNSTGIIDNAYRGEIIIGLTNITDNVIEVIDGERIAQGEIVPIITANLIEVKELSKTERGENGIGSTGGH